MMPANVRATLPADPNDGGLPITNRRLEYREDGGAWQLAGDGFAAGGQWTLSNVNDTTVDFRWRADNAAGEGAWSPLATEVVPDTLAPALSAPSAAKDGQTGATSLSVVTDEGNGTLYWGIYPDASTPSAADIVAGTGATVSGSQVVSAAGTQNVADQTGLTASTAYKAHYVQDDAAGNRSTAVASSTFTTDAVPVGDPITPIVEAAGDGQYYDFSDTSSLWQNAAGNVAVADGDAVARVDPVASGISGAANFTEITSSRFPLYSSANGGLDGDGINDRMNATLPAALTNGVYFAMVVDTSDAKFSLFSTASATGQDAYILADSGSTAKTASSGFAAVHTMMIDGTVYAADQPRNTTHSLVSGQGPTLIEFWGAYNVDYEYADIRIFLNRLAGFELDGTILQIVFMEDPGATDRATIRSHLASTNGITLP